MRQYLRHISPGVLVLVPLAMKLGCGLLPSEVDVDVEYPLAVAGGLSSVQPDPLPGVGAEVRQTLSNEGVPMDRVDAIRVARLELVHLSPICEALVGCDLEFIEQLTLRVQSPGQADMPLGSIRSPGATRLASMEVEDVDLAAHVRAEEMSLVGQISLASPSIQDVSLEVRATLRVDVDI